MATIHQSRRTFLTTLALLSGSVVLLVRYLTPRIPRQRRVLARAAMTALPVGGALVFQADRLALLRDKGGIYALSLVCTHLGCTLNVGNNQITCPCHGSRFDHGGHVLQGPADRALKRLRVEILGDTIEVVAE
jgi:nitrite reductase/ring-hydroxylating ferredoxin subunit